MLHWCRSTSRPPRRRGCRRERSLAFPSTTEPEIDTSAIEEAARAKGEADGLAQTEALRAQLKSAIAAFTSARDALKAPTCDAIAAAATAVIGAWTQTATDKELFTPVVTAWLEGTSGPATATVAPDAVAAMQELVG